MFDPSGLFEYAAIVTQINESKNPLVKFNAGGLVGAFAAGVGYAAGFTLGLIFADSLIYNQYCYSFEQYNDSPGLNQCKNMIAPRIEEYNNRYLGQFESTFVLTMLEGFLIGGINAAVPFTSLVTALRESRAYSILTKLSALHPLWNGLVPEYGIIRTLAVIPDEISGVYFGLVTSGTSGLLAFENYSLTVGFTLLSAFTAPLDPLSISNLTISALISGIGAAVPVSLGLWQTLFSSAK